jgi:hypothetical protein
MNTNDIAQTDADAIVRRDRVTVDMVIASPVHRDDDMTDEQIAAIDAQGVSPYRSVIEKMNVWPDNTDADNAFGDDVFDVIDTGDAHDVHPIWTDGRVVACIVFYPHPDA